jgi:hypothetical protein
VRQRLITPNGRAGAQDEGWLDVDLVMVVEVTSEEKDYPVKLRWNPARAIKFS